MSMESGADRHVGLGGFIGRRALQAVLVLLGTTLLVFAMVYALPGDPLVALYGERPISDSVKQELRERYHLDDSLVSQYARYMRGVLTGDLGEDFNGQPVSEMLKARWPVTAQLGLTAFAMSTIIGLVLGMVAALKRGRRPDLAILAGTTVLLSLPLFVVALVLQLVVGFQLGWLPIAGIDHGWPTSYLLPGLAIALISLAPVARFMRTTLVENQRAEYVRTARAKGLSPSRVFHRHLLRNSLIPVVTYLGIDLGLIMGGAIVVELVFNLPGMGLLLADSIRSYEGAVVVGVATVLVITFVVTNFIVDVLYGVLDPRIRRG